MSIMAAEKSPGSPSKSQPELNGLAGAPAASGGVEGNEGKDATKGAGGSIIPSQELIVTNLPDDVFESPISKVTRLYLVERANVVR